ncbi:MAG: hypothetical protein VKK98_07745 [Cyanobacteriota bacterium]|nr:hypothetical protein [Cyanobacteriota bacterium]
MDPETDPELCSSSESSRRVGAAVESGGYETFRERFETLIPTIQREWPELARHTLEATRGSLDDVVGLIASRTGGTASVVQGQLLDLLRVADQQKHRLADPLEPLEDQLEGLLEDLDATFRSKLERPMRERPLLTLGVAVTIGLLTGLLIGSSRRSV